MIRIETNKRYSWGHIDITVHHENTIINGSCVANDADKQAHELLSAGVACLKYAGMSPEQIAARVSQEITDEVKMHIAAGLQRSREARLRSAFEEIIRKSHDTAAIEISRSALDFSVQKGNQ